MIYCIQTSPTQKKGKRLRQSSVLGHSKTLHCRHAASTTEDNNEMPNCRTHKRRTFGIVVVITFQYSQKSNPILGQAKPPSDTRQLIGTYASLKANAEKTKNIRECAAEYLKPEVLDRSA